MPDDQDTALVARVLEGDPSAFETLVKRYERQVFNAAYRLTNSHEDARDIAQTVFVKAYEKLDTFNPKYRFFSWIYRMTVNEAINFREKHQREISAEVEINDTRHTPDQEADHRELAVEIDKAIVRLQFDYRLVLVLRHFQDLSYGEIAEILGIPEKTVKSRLYSARQLLADMLSPRLKEA